MERTILIIDDDADLTFIMADMLSGYGYKVESVTSVEEAFSVLEKKSFQLLILDINLPDGTGFELCSELRKVSTVPVILPAQGPARQIV